MKSCFKKTNRENLETNPLLREYLKEMNRDNEYGAVPMDILLKPKHTLGRSDNIQTIEVIAG